MFLAWDTCSKLIDYIKVDLAALHLDVLTFSVYLGCYWNVPYAKVSVITWCLSVCVSSSVLRSGLLCGTTQLRVWRSTFPVQIIKAWSEYVSSSQMIVAMATMKSPTSHHHPASKLNQAAPGSGTVCLDMLYLLITVKVKSHSHTILLLFIYNSYSVTLSRRLRSC